MAAKYRKYQIISRNTSAAENKMAAGYGSHRWQRLAIASS
jgi:hypothetical protein